MHDDQCELLASAIRLLPGNIAVLDSAGVIRAVNRNWTRFAEQNGIHNIAAVGPGTDYLGVCRAACAAGDGIAGEIADGLGRVLRGEWRSYQCEYPCHGPGIQRWFDLQATPLAGDVGAVVCHANITVARRARDLMRPAREAQAPPVTMCSSCKRIREAEQHWASIEDWLYRQHGDRFSHGLCEECTERLYPGLLDPGEAEPR